MNDSKEREMKILYSKRGKQGNVEAKERGKRKGKGKYWQHMPLRVRRGRGGACGGWILMGDFFSFYNYKLWL